MTVCICAWRNLILSKIIICRCLTISSLLICQNLVRINWTWPFALLARLSKFPCWKRYLTFLLHSLFYATCFQLSRHVKLIIYAFEFVSATLHRLPLILMRVFYFMTAIVIKIVIWNWNIWLILSNFWPLSRFTMSQSCRHWMPVLFVFW